MASEKVSKERMESLPVCYHCGLEIWSDLQRCMVRPLGVDQDYWPRCEAKEGKNG